MSVLDTLRVQRARFGGTLTPLEAAQVLNWTAWLHRNDAPALGLLRKDAGNGVVFGAARVALDILMFADGHIFDVFIDSPDATVDPVYTGRCEPAWQDKGAVDASRFVAAVQPINDGPEPPHPPQTPAPCDLSGVEDALLALARQLSQLEEQMLRMEDRQSALEARAVETAQHVKSLDGLLLAFVKHYQQGLSGRTFIGPVTLKPPAL